MVDWLNEYTESSKVQAIAQGNEAPTNLENQFTAIHFAAFNGHLDVLKQLTLLGADLAIKNNLKINCLHLAS